MDTLALSTYDTLFTLLLAASWAALLLWSVTSKFNISVRRILQLQSLAFAKVDCWTHAAKARNSQIRQQSTVFQDMERDPFHGQWPRNPPRIV
jgi:hypothetical protein